MKKVDVIEPTAIKFPVAYAGDKNNIPLAATGTNKASITEGFPAITMQSVTDGGLPPYGQDFNGLFYLATDYKAYLQDGGYITFNETVSNLIGGYPQGAILDYYDSNSNSYTKVISLIDDNTYNFVTTPAYIDNTHWQDVNFGGANLSLSNLNNTGISFINNSKALETGAVYDNADIYKDVFKYAHSSFDISKFGAVGTPTIDDDGTITSPNTSNYATITVAMGDFVEIGFNLSTLTSTQSLIQIGGYNRLIVGGNGVIAIYADESNATANNVNFNGLPVVTTDKDYILTVQLDGTNAKATLNNITDGVVSTDTQAFTHKFYATSADWQVGRGFTGTINGRSLNIKNSGIPVFSGNITGIDTFTINGSTVTIPYIQSSEQYGSKIVDAAYRTQVTAVYNAGYPNRYYTIDEINKNFTLPCGEIYGMFEQIKTQLAVDITDNGTTHIEKYPDGRLYMSGRYTWQTSSTSVPFVQPVLSANGTPGGANFAVTSGGELFPTTYPAYKAFDGNPATFYESSNGNPAYIAFYNPDKLKVTALTVTNALASRETTTYAIDASDDGNTWTEILTGSSNARGNGSQFIVNLSSNTNSYYYYRLRSTGIAYGWCVADIKITATYEDSGSPTINRIILPVATTNNYYNPVLTGINADISGVYPSSVNTGYIDLTGTATNNDVIGWSVHAKWK